MTPKPIKKQNFSARKIPNREPEENNEPVVTMKSSETIRRSAPGLRKGRAGRGRR
jgi:hypothetical protein